MALNDDLVVFQFASICHKFVDCMHHHAQHRTWRQAASRKVPDKRV